METLVLEQALSATRRGFRWIHTHSMVAGGLTKGDRMAFMFLRAFIAKPRWKPIFDERFVSAKKCAQLCKGIFEDVTEEELLSLGERLRERRVGSKNAATLKKKCCASERRRTRIQSRSIDSRPFRRPQPE